MPSPRVGDDAIFWCAALALVCGAAALSASLYGVENQVLERFAPKLAWLIFAPALFAVLLGLVGLRVSRRPPSKLLRLQLAAILLLVASLLGLAGIFAYVSSGITSKSLIDGCSGFLSFGVWTQAGRIAAALEEVEEENTELRCGMQRCRQIDPLVFDLSRCGVRARCGGKAARRSDEVPLYSWLQHQQLALGCGGLCSSEAPLFGATTMRESLLARPACVSSLAESAKSHGHLLGIFATVMSLPLIFGALALFRFGSTRAMVKIQEHDRSSDEDGDVVRFQAVGFESMDRQNEAPAE